MTSKRLIYFIRHGQTDWNAEGRFQGQHDIPLNDHGRGQASGNGEALARHAGPDVADFDFVSSPLKRTRETIERVRAALGLEASAYRTDERLLEISFGEWEGHTLTELKNAYPQKMQERDSSKWHYVPPGEKAESYEILSWRIGAWLNSIEKPTVCVSHGGVIRTIFKLTGNLPEAEASTQAIFQDKILRLQGDQLDWLD